MKKVGNAEFSRVLAPDHLTFAIFRPSIQGETKPIQAQVAQPQLSRDRSRNLRWSFRPLVFCAIYEPAFVWDTASIKSSGFQAFGPGTASK